MYRVEKDRLQAVIESLCKNRAENEYFRLSTESNCRDAVRCVQNDFKGGHSLAAVRCPTGLVFDLDGQTCNWASQVSTKVCYLLLLLFWLEFVWYFVSKIVMTYCEKKKNSSDREKLLKFEVEGREFSKFRNKQEKLENEFLLVLPMQV